MATHNPSSNLTKTLDGVRVALAGRYIVQREIGRGGMSRVYLAKDAQHDRDVAIKVLDQHVSQLLSAERFLREIQITAKLARLRCRIYEQPISYAGRDYDQGKKITWRDGVAALYHIVRFSVVRRRPRPVTMVAAEEIAPRPAELPDDLI